MSFAEEFRERNRTMWAAGNWDRFSMLTAPVGELVRERSDIQPGMTVLDVGCGSGGNIAIPAARMGAEVVGADLTPELLAYAKQRAEAAGVEVEWVEADAQDLPFPDGRFDRVISMFGAMFAPDHRRAAAELVRVCAPGGRVLMTTWVTDGFAGEMFKLQGAFMPQPRAGDEPPLLWGAEEHVEEVFAAAGVQPSIARESMVFEFQSVEEAVRRYAEDFGPFVVARGALEPQDRWDEFLDGFAQLVKRFNEAKDGSARVRSWYFVITVDR
jgi:SAM-dependent methyltransferase